MRRFCTTTPTSSARTHRTEGAKEHLYIYIYMYIDLYKAALARRATHLGPASSAFVGTWRHPP
eukprot:9426121-Pyramimonas_sp.AAC.1